MSRMKLQDLPTKQNTALEKSKSSFQLNTQSQNY